MASETRANIKRKRKVKRKQRRLRIFRLFLFFVITSGILAALFTGLFYLYEWGSGVYRTYDAMYQEYSERKMARVGEENPRFDNYTNVLILGIDEGGNPDGTSDKEADTIILLSLDNNVGRVRLVTIPGSTLIPVPGQNFSARAASLYTAGGASLMLRAVSDLLGVSIHQYVTVDMQTFAELIDVLGGIDIYAEGDMNYEDPEAGLAIHIAKGYQHMDGEMAQKYLRYRSTDLGEVGRVQRQQRFMKILYEKILSLETLAKLPQIADIFQNRVTTSTEIFDSAHLANVLRHLSKETPITVMLPGEISDDDAYWLPHQNEIDLRMQELFPQPETNGDDGTEE